MSSFLSAFKKKLTPQPIPYEDMEQLILRCLTPGPEGEAARSQMHSRDPELAQALAEIRTSPIANVLPDKPVVGLTPPQMKQLREELSSLNQQASEAARQSPQLTARVEEFSKLTASMLHDLPSSFGVPTSSSASIASSASSSLSRPGRTLKQFFSLDRKPPTPPSKGVKHVTFSTPSAAQTRASAQPISTTFVVPAPIEHVGGIWTGHSVPVPVPADESYRAFPPIPQSHASAAAPRGSEESTVAHSEQSAPLNDSLSSNGSSGSYGSYGSSLLNQTRSQGSLTLNESEKNILAAMLGSLESGSDSEPDANVSPRGIPASDTYAIQAPPPPHTPKPDPSASPQQASTGVPKRYQCPGI